MDCPAQTAEVIDGALGEVRRAPAFVAVLGASIRDDEKTLAMSARPA